MKNKFIAKIQSIREGKIAPVYFLHGNDSFLQTYFLQSVTDVLFTQQQPHKVILDPDETNLRDLFDQLTGLDLFSPKTLFVLYHPEKIKGKKFQDQLRTFCTTGIGQSCLVIMYSEWKPRTAFLRQLADMADMVETTTPMFSDLRQWTKRLFSLQGQDVSDDIISLMIDMAGDSLSHLNNEIKKICLSLDEGEKITQARIKQFSGWQREHQRWEFFQALGEHKDSLAIELGQMLIRQQETLISVIYNLSAFYLELWFIKQSPGTSRGKRGYMPLSPSVVRKLPSYAQRMSLKEIEVALLRLAKLDRKIKSETVDDETELLQFLLQTRASHGQ